ncbi:hypothetical protein BB347_14635 [Natronorubrum daqingense]|uniref:Uncharacterized protein n=1 Tax=Natronorubrum daqingense TaxID=588898 RepID=A0A1P8RGH6_9EURY|nr:hypothetical protein BB347_14635 [Natronorubrum daqingense]
MIDGHLNGYSVATWDRSGDVTRTSTGNILTVDDRTRSRLVIVEPHSLPSAFFEPDPTELTVE